MLTTEIVVGPQKMLGQKLVDSVASLRAADPIRPLQIVVPSNLLATGLSRRLAQKIPEGLFNVRFPTFIELARMLAGPDPRGRPLATRLNLLAAIRVSSNKGADYFGELSDHIALHEGLLATLSDLENGTVTADDLRRQAARLDAAGPARAGDAARIRAVAAICDESLRVARESCEPVRDVFARASANASSAKGPLFVYGFHDFTELQLRVLASLGSATGVRVFLADERVGSTPYVVGTINRLEAAGFVTTRLEAGVHPHEQLAARLFKQRSEPIDQTAVHFTSAPSQVSEVEDVVRGVLAQLEADASPEDIAIAYRGDDPYPRLLAATLQRAGLSYFLARGTRLADTRHGKSVLLLLSLAVSNLGRREVIDFLTFAALRPEILSGANPESWEELSRRAAIVAGRVQWESRLAAYRDLLARQEKRYPERAAALARRRLEITKLLAFVGPLFDRLATVPAESTWAGYVEWLAAFVADYFEPHDGSEAVAAALRHFAALSGEVVSFTDFQHTVRLHLEQKYERHGSVGRGHIFVGQPRDFRGLEFHTVFVVGLAERSFPQPLRPDALLLDSDRRQLTADTGHHLSLSRQSLDEERLLFAGLVASADKLNLSFPRFDEKKPQPRYPSPFLLALAEALHGRRFDFNLAGLDYTRLSDVQPDREVPPENAIAEADYDVAVLASGARPTLEHVAYLEAVAPHFRLQRTASWSRNVSVALTPYDGLIQADDALADLRSNLAGGVLSATALEQYAECPHRFFLDHALGLEVLDEPESVAELSPLDRGVIVHNILETFYRTLSEHGLLPLQPIHQAEYYQLLAAAAEREFQDAEQRGVTGMFVGWKANRRVLFEELSRFLYQELEEGSDGLTPSAFEYAFGDSEASPPLQIEALPGLSLRFRGKVDRIDTGEGAARVLDYKSGKTKARTRKDGQVSFAGGRQLQLPIYMLAAARDLGLPVEQVDAAYSHINREAGFSIRRLDGEGFAARRRDFELVLRLIAESMAGGVFVPRTLKGTTCKNCDFRFVCPSRVRFQEERKADREKNRHLRALELLKDVE